MRVVDFKRLRMRLLKGGIAPKFVKRTIMEMSAHLEDLIKQEKQNGVSEAEARALAFSALGDEDALVSETLAKKELMSWSRRYTKSFYLIVPLVCYFIFMFCLLYFGIGTISDIAQADRDGELQTFLIYFARTVLFCIEYVITPFLALVFTYIAIRRNVHMMWPLIGIVVLSFFGSGFETILREPIAGSREGGVNLIWGWSFLPWRWVQPPWDQTSEQALRVIVTLGLAFMAFKHYRPYEAESN